MPRLEYPPELADGGFWYRVPRIGDGSDAEPYRPAGFDAHSYCAWYAGGVAIVRTPDLVAGVPSAGLAGAALSGVKPYGRIGGR